MHRSEGDATSRRRLFKGGVQVNEAAGDVFDSHSKGDGTGNPASKPTPIPKPDPNRIIDLPGAEKKDRAPNIAKVDDAIECAATALEDSAAPILKALSDIAAALAPHYDLTKSGEGVRAVRDMYADLGLGYFGDMARVALAATLAKHGDAR